jgi:hypothetical protein
MPAKTEYFQQVHHALEQMFQTIESRDIIERINLDEYDSIFKNSDSGDGIDIQQKLTRFRETIIEMRADDSFWNAEIPRLISLLENAIDRLKNHQHVVKEIGGKDVANKEIIEMLNQGILTTETVIYNDYKGQTFSGHLTYDGFIELDLKGLKRKLSLRRAAYYAWKCDSQNQWLFWKAKDINGHQKTLDHFRNLIK